MRPSVPPARNPRPERSLGAGVWRLADPKISLASAASILVAAALAARDSALAWGWLGLTVLGIFCIEVAKNASGDVFDFDSGADPRVAPEDRSPFSGGKRVLVDGLLSRRQTVLVAAVAYLLGAVAGLAIVLLREPRVLWLGAAGLACAYFYQAPPVQLAYRGLGELAVAVCYGPMIAAGTYLVQTGAVTREAIWVSAPLGLLIAAFLWINEFPDVRADRQSGKRTLVVRLGTRRASRAFAALAAVAFGLQLALPLSGLPLATWWGVAGLPFAVAAARRLIRDPESTRRVVPAQAWTLLAFLLSAAGTAVGLLL